VVRTLAVVARAVTIAGAILCAIACGKKSGSDAPPPEVTGLSAVPSSAEIVIAIDVEKLAASPIVARAAEQLLARDAQLAESWAHVRDECKIDVAKQIKRLTIALGPAPNPAKPGTGPMLMVATGAIGEAELSACIRSLVGKGGGTLTAKPLETRTLYQVKDSSRTMFFAFGSPNTVVLSVDEKFIGTALDTKGKKAMDHPELAAWAKLTNQNAPLWMMGRVSERVKGGLVRVSGGAIKTGPTAFVASLDLTEGAKVELSTVMANADDAKQLESQIKAQLGMLVMIAQAKSMGPLIQKVKLATDGKLVRISVALTMDDMNHVLSVLDPAPPPAQDSPPPSPPATGSGSSAGSGSAQ
jgi:hypothetical protein